MFINNRQFIKDLGINTSATSTPSYSNLCVASEIGLNTDVETQDFYVFCDAIQRKIVTGASVMLSGTVKLDMNNSAIVQLLGDVHSLIKDGSIAQFNNQLVQFDLVTGIQNAVLEYTTYQVPVTLSLSDLGGAAEDVSEFSFEMTIVGKGTVVTG